jgi:hypothetical protein
MRISAWFIITIAAIFVFSPVSFTDRSSGNAGSAHETGPSTGATIPILRSQPAPRATPQVTPNCTVSRYVIDTSSVCDWVHATLNNSGGNTIVVPYELTIEGSGTVIIANLTPVFINSTLIVEGGAKVIFGGGNVLYIGYSSSLEVLQGSSVLLNNSPIRILAGDISRAGTILVDHGSLMGNATTTPPPTPEVYGVNLEGPLSSLAVNDSEIRWVNATQQIGTVTFSGSFSPLTTRSSTTSRWAMLAT